MLGVLNDVERRTLDAYVERIADRLVSIRVFGSVARGESGRQISPQFRTADAHASSPSREAIDADAVEVWPCR